MSSLWIEALVHQRWYTSDDNADYPWEPRGTPQNKKCVFTWVACQRRGGRARHQYPGRVRAERARGRRHMLRGVRVGRRGGSDRGEGGGTGGIGGFWTHEVRGVQSGAVSHGSGHCAGKQTRVSHRQGSMQMTPPRQTDQEIQLLPNITGSIIYHPTGLLLQRYTSHSIVFFLTKMIIPYLLSYGILQLNFAYQIFKQLNIESMDWKLSLKWYFQSAGNNV